MKKYLKIRPYQFAFALDQILITILFIGVVNYHEKDIFFSYANTTKIYTSYLFHFALSITIWLIFNFHKRIIRYYHAKDFLHLILIVALLHVVSCLTSISIFKFSKTFAKVYLESYFLTVATLIFLRYLISYFYDSLLNFQSQSIKKNILIYGAGEMGLILKKTIESSVKKNYNVVGFLDDDATKIGRYLNGIKIYNPFLHIESLVAKNHITDIIIATNKIKPETKSSFLEKIIHLNVRVRQLNSLTNWYEKDFSLNKLSTLKIDDLMCRQPIELHNQDIENSFSTKTVLVTGAAGSIGKELVEMLYLNNVKKLICVDFSETGLYDLQQSLINSKKSSLTQIFFELTDINDLVDVTRIFEKHKPEIVFNAAAYKHVPMLEEFPWKAVQTNVFGLLNVLHLSLRFKIERFVLISTDKAINPTSVMGITKRLSELIVRSFSIKHSESKFMITRFGNVLGSNGSVVPLFKKQILAGGPVTITHPEMERYFMTIPEACKLVLEACIMGNGGEVFVFDMGKPVKIIDLAKNMIRLAGLVPEHDIKLKIVGIRKGEKLSEDIFSNKEEMLNTHNEKIFISSENPISSEVVFDLIAKLRFLGKINQPDQYRDSLIKLYQQVELSSLATKSINTKKELIEIN